MTIPITTCAPSLWPDFKAPRHPPGLLATVAQFADELRPRTGGTVGAMLLPVDRGERFAFSAHVVGRHDLCVGLFTLSPRGSAVVAGDVISVRRDRDRDRRYAFDAYVIASVFSVTPDTARRWIRDGKIDPTDLGSLIGLAKTRRRKPYQRRA